MAKHKTRTRRQIIEALKTRGNLDAKALSNLFNLTGMAIRQHLYALQDEGMVDYTESPRPVGRPAKLWRLTAAADDYFPDSHAELTVGLIETMKRALGDQGFETVLRARAKEQVASYQDELATTSSLLGRAKGLANIRSREGYMAHVEKDHTGAILLVENHCPICVAAKSCSGLCRMELDVFQTTLGPDTQVERIDHILAGARRCAYRIKKNPEAN